jgi:hypothetical protein
MPDEVIRTDAAWKALLPPEQYCINRNKGYMSLATPTFEPKKAQD